MNRAGHPTDTSICTLLLRRSPLTIFRGVWPIIVLTVKTHTFWTFAHIGVEILEGVPPLADDDSAFSVATPLSALPTTSTLRTTPRVIRSAWLPVLQSVPVLQPGLITRYTFMTYFERRTGCVLRHFFLSKMVGVVGFEPTL